MIYLLIFGWISLGVAGAIAFDKFIYLQYSRFRRNWERDGKPFGFFWTTPEVKRAGFWSFLGSSSARRRATFDWLFATPAWVKESSAATAWLYAYRLLSLISLLSPLVAVLFLEYLT